MERYLDIFKALSDKTRLRIFRLLCRFSQKACVCEIVDALQESQHKVSRHLKILKNARLLQETKTGKWVYYEVEVREDPLLQKLTALVLNLHNDLFFKDEERLKERIALRKNGKCVIGMHH